MAGSIKGITIELDGNATKLNKALSTVNKSANQTQRQLKNIEKALKFNPGNTQALATKFSLLSTKIAETREKLNLLKEASRQAAEQLARGEISQADFDALQTEIAATEAELKQLENEYKRLGSVGAQQVAALGTKMEALGSKIAGVGDKLTMRLTMPLALLGAKTVKSFAEVDKTMTLTNSTMGNTAEQADLLTDAMKQAAANSTYGMSDAATATLNFARAGLTAEQAAAALAPAMNLAAGEGGELDTVSGGLVATINGFHGSFNEAAHYADVFANACNNSALDVNSLSEAMSVAAPIFSAAGYTVNDAALYMGVMANNGIEADKAANSLKTGLARLVSPAKEGAEMMKKLGIEVTNADGSMKDSVQIQNELHDAFANLSESEQIAAASAIFGKNQMAPWLALINSAPGDVEKLSKALEENGTAGQMASDMMSGFGGSLEKLKSSLDVAGYSLGAALAPAISKVADGIQKAIDWFNALPPSAQQTIATIGLIVAAIGPVLAIGGRLIGGIGKLLKLAPMIVNGFNLVKGAIVAVGSAIPSLIGFFASLNPVVLAVIAVLGALVAAGIAVYKNWDTLKVKAQEAWNVVTSAFQQMGEQISGAWNTLKTNTTNAWNTIKNTVTTNFNTAKTNVINTANAIKNGISNAISSIPGKASEKFNRVKTAITQPIEAAKNAVSTAISKIKGFFNTTISGPHIKLPHISVSGRFSLNPPSVPHFSVSWYRKAYQNAMMFTSPTVLGTPYGYKGFGDGPGGEIVMGKNYMLGMVQEAVGSSQMARNVGALVQIVSQYLPDIAEKEFALNGENFIYANRRNINNALGSEAIASAKGW